MRKPLSPAVDLPLFGGIGGDLQPGFHQPGPRKYRPPRRPSLSAERRATQSSTRPNHAWTNQIVSWPGSRVDWIESPKAGLIQGIQPERRRDGSAHQIGTRHRNRHRSSGHPMCRRRSGRRRGRHIAGHPGSSNNHQRDACQQDGAAVPNRRQPRCLPTRRGISPLANTF